MAGNLQVLRRRIRSVSSTRKITKAQELVASSRIAKAQERVKASRPYATAITEVLTTLAGSARISHPLLVPRERIRRSGVLVVTSDRGLCGAYNANALRMTEQLVASLRGDGKQVTLFVVGRRGLTYYRFRNRPIAANWTGFSERPGFVNAQEIGEVLIESFLAGGDDGERPPDGLVGVDELFVVYTQFRSLMTQSPVALRLAPIEVSTEAGGHDLMPLYEFEPDAGQLLAALLPKYVTARVYAALLDSAASESASRRRAMKSATDNADELIKAYTRQMNSVRQAQITQEISEIVGGANALAAAGSEV